MSVSFVVSRTRISRIFFIIYVLIYLGIYNKYIRQYISEV